MATRLRNIVFCALAIVITCAAILYKIADLSEFLPEELDNGKRSYLEGADLQPLPEITLDGFVSGSLQDELESYFSGCWPARDSALLANASLQRSFISAAALPFGYDTWHTYYGSAQVYYAPQYALFETPDAPSEENATLLEDAASAINELHEKHPDIKIIVAMSDRSRITNANPLHSLSNNTADYGFFEKHLFGNLDEEITVVTQRKETPEEFFAYYFKSDHHWNVFGAYEMYESLCEELNVEAVKPTSRVEFPQMPFYALLHETAWTAQLRTILPTSCLTFPSIRCGATASSFSVTMPTSTHNRMKATTIKYRLITVTPTILEAITIVSFTLIKKARAASCSSAIHTRSQSRNYSPRITQMKSSLIPDIIKNLLRSRYRMPMSNLSSC